ncbi:glycerol-3-phosphate 1-O-acyltransferase PlsY [Spirochaeta isovalerica]|uniref:Glycerol-3-phosphate acyltransferase n=1 Tax=Spirochaeta isovalerica TaxID=150 RepID=A0A841RCP1_9SPIO|nr:glycerol-3-phosphate 1-O-acyltransferase PlsY [Spirochaeta isovalerica]MBB6481436.1 glycerol-3-phosphate acyltransferase PlsY [Spirochaeta isovalerica]
MTLLLIAGAYLIGSVPAALLAGFIITGKDIRKEGSGNAGATNVFRILGAKAALPVALFDFSKAFFPVFYSQWLSGFFGIQWDNQLLLKLLILSAVILGHVFPIWSGFKGGKAVASGAGGVSALFPPALPACLILFLIIAFLTGYVSVASLTAAWFLPIFYRIFTWLAGYHYSPELQVFFIATAIVITVLHRKNIVRLMRGEENRFRRKRD